MKILILMTLVSCGHFKYTPYDKPVKKLTHIDKMYNCVIRLIEQNGIGATEAQQVCEKTLRRRK